MAENSDSWRAVDLHTHTFSLHPGSGCYISSFLRGRLLARYLKWRYGLGDGLSPEVQDQRLQTVFREAYDGWEQMGSAVILGLDAVYSPNGKLDWERTHFYVPNDYIFSVSQRDQRLLAGPSVHPNRADALEELARCREQGAVLIKWLPNTQAIEVGNSRNRRFYRALRDLGLPLLCHTGPEHTLPSLDNRLGDPFGLRMALDEGVTVIAAHGGGCELFRGGYFEPFLRLLLEYPNLYADTSGLCLPHRKRYLLKLLRHPEVHHKLVHGSDFPLPVNAWNFIGHLPVSQIRALNRIESPIERDLAIKQTLGFPNEIFYRGSELIRPMADAK